MKLYPVVILAGGLATRLRPLTEKIPKAMVQVGGHPFIFHQLRLLRARGVQRVIISAWYRGEIIQNYVKAGENFGLQVEYVFDGERPLGTGGAVRKALNLFDGPFFVLYGDSYLPCDYVAVQAHFDRYDQPGLMTVYFNQGKWDTSNAEVVDDQIVCYDKEKHTPRMEFIDYGLGIFRPEAFSHLHDGQSSDLAKVYQSLVAQRRLLAYPIGQRFYEIGSMQGLRELDNLLAEDPDRFIQREKP